MSEAQADDIKGPVAKTDRNTGNVPTAYKRTEVGVIPSEWNVKRIGEIFQSTAGGDFDPNVSSDVQSDTHPYPIYANGLSQKGLYGFCRRACYQPGSISITARGTLGKVRWSGLVGQFEGKVKVVFP